MDPLALLIAEHRVISSVLDALDQYTDALVSGTADPARLADFVTFLRGYADEIHHGKEEQILFPAVKRRRVPEQLAPVLAAIDRDHATARLLTGDLAGFAGRAASWTASDRTRIRRLAREYTVLLRRHIAQEDGTVLPQAVRALPPQALQEVAGASERFEVEHAAARETLRALAERLVSQQ